MRCERCASESSAPRLYQSGPRDDWCAEEGGTESRNENVMIIPRLRLAALLLFCCSIIALDASAEYGSATAVAAARVVSAPVVPVQQLLSTVRLRSTQLRNEIELRDALRFGRPSGTPLPAITSAFSEEGSSPQSVAGLTSTVSTDAEGNTAFGYRVQLSPSVSPSLVRAAVLLLYHCP